MKYFKVKPKEVNILLDKDSEYKSMTKVFTYDSVGKDNVLTSSQTEIIKKSCLKIYETVCKIEGYNENSVKNNLKKEKKK